MKLQDLRLGHQKKLEEFIEFFEKISTRSLDLLDSLALQTLILEDPYCKAFGLDDVKELLLKRLKICGRTKYSVSGFVWDESDDIVTIHWTLFYISRRKFLFFYRDSPCEFKGSSKIMFSPQGDILSIEEVWEEHDALNVQRYKKV